MELICRKKHLLHVRTHENFQIWVWLKTTLYRQVSTSDAYVIDTLWSVRDDNVYSGVWSFWGRWQRIIHVVIFNADDNLEYKLSSFYRWELIRCVLIFSTDDTVKTTLLTVYHSTDNIAYNRVWSFIKDNTSKNTLSPVKRWHLFKCVVIGVPMTTWLLSCYLHRWQP